MEAEDQCQNCRKWTKEMDKKGLMRRCREWDQFTLPQFLCRRYKRRPEGKEGE